MKLSKNICEIFAINIHAMRVYFYLYGKLIISHFQSHLCRQYNNCNGYSRQGKSLFNLSSNKNSVDIYDIMAGISMLGEITKTKKQKYVFSNYWL